MNTIRRWVPLLKGRSTPDIFWYQKRWIIWIGYKTWNCQNWLRNKEIIAIHIFLYVTLLSANWQHLMRSCTTSSPFILHIKYHIFSIFSKVLIFSLLLGNVCWGKLFSSGHTLAKGLGMFVSHEKIEKLWKCMHNDMESWSHMTSSSTANLQSE